MWGVRTLYGAALDDLKIETQNERMDGLTNIDITPGIITISLGIHILSSTAIVFFCGLIRYML